MNALNGALTSVFNILLAPFELLGEGNALILVSGLFGILGLVVFKYVSFQRSIKGAKDKIKGHMIEIRLYQDDLVIVAQAFCKVMLRNLQYVGLNFLSFAPLLAPMVLVFVQFVVRYAFGPIPVEELRPDFLPGSGTMIEVELAEGREPEISGLTIVYPKAIHATSPLVRSVEEGRAWQEVIALEPGEHELALQLAGESTTKTLVAGDPARIMQPERGRGFWGAVLWPAEDSFGSSSAFARVAFVYPDRDLGWLPGGIVGILIVFAVASILFGVAVMKPLKIQV
jgi:hypothetical protein